MYPGTFVYTLDCIHRVHTDSVTVDCTSCRMYAVKCVHLYIFTFVFDRGVAGGQSLV
jgi:hypothetical protein